MQCVFDSAFVLSMHGQDLHFFQREVTKLLFLFFDLFRQPLNGRLSVIENKETEAVITADSFKKAKMHPVVWLYDFSDLDVTGNADAP